MVHLTPRLQTVADFVEQGSVIADIGTDHAYIPAFLIQHGTIKHAYACDIKKGPLENARRTCCIEQISGVEFRLCNGMQGLEEEAIQTFVIAGMGGEMIAQIIDEAPWCRTQAYTFILQPMTKANVLRAYLCTHGFQITQERLAAEKDKLYTVMHVCYSANIYKPDEAFLLLGNTKEDALFDEYKKRELQRLKRIELSLRHKQDSVTQRNSIKKTIQEIEVY